MVERKRIAHLKSVLKKLFGHGYFRLIIIFGLVSLTFFKFPNFLLKHRDLAEGYINAISADVTRPWMRKVPIRLTDKALESADTVPIEIRDSSDPQTIVEACEEGKKSKKVEQDRLAIILVTPTYARPAQALHFSHLNSMLRLIPPPILWIVVESANKTEETATLLTKTAGKCLLIGTQEECTRINYIHLASPLKHENKALSRGVIQRNYALDYIETNRIEGIVYFLDDDNTYTPDLFIEIRKVRRVGVWPVGFLWSSDYQRVTNRAFKPYVERPLVQRAMPRPAAGNGSEADEKEEPPSSVVIGWETFDWAANMGDRQRKFQTDMAGFAFRSNLLWIPTSLVTGRPKKPVRFRSRPMFIETLFLDRLVENIRDLEPLANDCQDINVWHKKLETDYTDAYPKDWFLPQPQNLKPDVYKTHHPRYVVHKERYYLDGHHGKLAFGYMKHEVSNPPKKDASKNKTHKRRRR